MTVSTINHSVFENFASILSYPADGIIDDAKQIARLSRASESFSACAAGFVSRVKDLEPKNLEEIFTYTFDMNPSTCLEIGWHLFGESYERGEFLVKMRQSLKKYNIAESTELPDHISHCLKVLAQLDKEDASSFVHDYILKALNKICDSMTEKNEYTPAVKALKLYLIENYPFKKEIK